MGFDPRDPATAGLTTGEAHEMCLAFARRSFPGHQAVACTRLDGDNGSGNARAHIAIDSVRKLDGPKGEWVRCRAEWEAGGKTNVTREPMDGLRLVADLQRYVDEGKSGADGRPRGYLALFGRGEARPPALREGPAGCRPAGARVAAPFP